MLVYIYDDLTPYGIFDDLKIKSGYNKTLVLFNGANVEIDTTEKTFRFLSTTLTDVLNGANWAIGDEFGNLYLACNENLEGFNFFKKHFVQDLLEIGNREIPEPPIIHFDELIIEATYSGTTSYQSSNYSFVGILEVEGTASLGQDEYEITTVQYAVQGIMTFQTAHRSYTATVDTSTTVKVLDYQWLPVSGQEPTVNQTCELSYDELNVKCDTQTPSSCTWDTVGGQYTSIRDRSDNVGGSCLITPSTKTECAFLAGQWYCQDYEARITDYDYSDCFICVAVEVEE